MNMASDRCEKILELIDHAHSQDPNKIEIDGQEIPYELHYSEKMTRFLEMRKPDATDALRIAIRAQHFRRWEVPRDSYPMTKAGYFAWRTHLKKRQAEQAAAICVECGLSSAESDRVAALIRKENLKEDEETQVLEDVACLVFLDDQFADFEKQHDEVKVVHILQKTWGKMSELGRQQAFEINMSDHSRQLVNKALQGE